MEFTVICFSLNISVIPVVLYRTPIEGSEACPDKKLDITIQTGHYPLTLLGLFETLLLTSK